MKKEITFPWAFLCLAFLLVSMTMSVFWLDMPVQVTLLMSMSFTIIVLVVRGQTWEQIAKYIEYGGAICIMPTLTMIIIGPLMGAWIASGTVPYIIYWGLKLINPSLFLVTTCLICIFTSLASGSSWSTAGTVGVALMAVGGGLGMNPAMTAGAVISGAYFGDKMSPMSETTVLAPAIAEADLFDHIRSMMYTTTPALIITLIAYGIFGISFANNSVDVASINQTVGIISQNFQLNALTLIPPAVVLFMAIKKYPSIPTLLIATGIAALLAIFMQGETLTTITKFMDTGYVSQTGIADIDRLLTRGGLQGMAGTMSLGIVGIIYGAIMEKSGLLKVFLSKLKIFTKSVGGLVLTTVTTALVLLGTTASQSLAIIVTGRMFLPEYKSKDMLPQTLSRTLEDAGTLLSPLVPWSLCGVFMGGMLGVSAVQFAPYAMFCWLCPLIAIIYGFTNKFQWKTGEIPSKKTYETAEMVKD